MYGMCSANSSGYSSCSLSCGNAEYRIHIFSPVYPGYSSFIRENSWSFPLLQPAAHAPVTFTSMLIFVIFVSSEFLKVGLSVSKIRRSRRPDHNFTTMHTLFLQIRTKVRYLPVEKSGWQSACMPRPQALLCDFRARKKPRMHFRTHEALISSLCNCHAGSSPAYLSYNIRYRTVFVPLLWFSLYLLRFFLRFLLYLSCTFIVPDSYLPADITGTV